MDGTILFLSLFLFIFTFYSCVHEGGALSTIVKDFRENHTDTTVLFTVSVVPGTCLLSSHFLRKLLSSISSYIIRLISCNMI